MGSSFWANAGADVDVTITGLAYVVGARFALDARRPATHFSTSYRAPVVRKYDTQDAVGNTSNASNVHDIHINNGSTNARDMLWPATASHVDPPSIVVLNCAPTESYVWSHSHPQGALYLPFTGKICFETDTVRPREETQSHLFTCVTVCRTAVL